MKNKIKLSEIRQNELQKDEIHSLTGGVHPSCAVACSCTCECSLGDPSAKNNDMNSKNDSHLSSTQNVHQSNYTGRATGSLHF